MKIIGAHVYEIDLPYSGGVYRLSGGREYHSFTSLIVRLETDTGLTGWGESCPFGNTYIAAHAEGSRRPCTSSSPLSWALIPANMTASMTPWIGPNGAFVSQSSP